MQAERGVQRGVVRVTFSKVANDKSLELAGGFWTTSKRGGARGGGGGDFYRSKGHGTRGPPRDEGLRKSGVIVSTDR